MFISETPELIIYDKTEKEVAKYEICEKTVEEIGEILLKSGCQLRK
jgi:hypothetical protein